VKVNLDGIKPIIPQLFMLAGHINSLSGFFRVFAMKNFSPDLSGLGNYAKFQVGFVVIR
jgi:hypothetical protein